tara:strand:- start:176 stop:595 length:420 start_codon:yes stop_codon:yes gene_type:complete
MNTQTITDTKFKFDEIKALAALMLSEGWEVAATNDQRGTTYIHFSDDGKNVGYAQQERYGGVTFSTVHKPNSKCGTGFAVTDRDSGNFDPTLVDAREAFMFAPHWAMQRDREAVQKFDSFPSYLESPMNKIVEKFLLVA